jgi:hypothetical protein
MKQKTLAELLAHCEANGLEMVAYYDDPNDVDYRGKSAKKAEAALEACDEMNLVILDAERKRWGYAFIVNDAGGDPEEQINDHSTDDRLEAWMRGEAA